MIVIGIGHNSLKQVTHSKVLGVEIDQFLSWDKHVDSIAKKRTSGIGAIRRIREFVDRETLVAIHNAIVQPNLNYCSEVWDTLGEGLSKRLGYSRAREIVFESPVQNSKLQSFHVLTQSLFIQLDPVPTRG